MKDHIRDIYIILIIVMIGALVRFPIANVRDVDTSKLLDPDSYLYARLAEEFYEEPMSEWEFIMYRSDDPIMNTVSSENDQFVTNLMPIIVAFICKIFKFLDIHKVIYYFSTFFCPLSAIPAYLFVKKHTNTFGGIVAGLAMSTSVSYFMHTLHGFFDTDSIIMVLAATLISLSIEIVLETNLKKQLSISILMIALVALFSVSWEIYYFYIAVAVAVMLIMLIVAKVIKYDCGIKITMATIILLVAECALISGQDLIISLKRYITNVFIGIENNWPNEAKYISELESPAFIKGGLNNSFFVNATGVVNWLGGIPFSISIIAIVLLILSKLVLNRKKQNLDKKMILILVPILAWILAASAIVPSGIRFVQLLAMPCNFVLGLGAGYIFDRYESIKFQSWKKDILILVISVFVFGSFMFCGIKFALIISVVLLILGISSSSISFRKVLITFMVTVFACPIISEYKISKASVPYVGSDFVLATEYIESNVPKDSTLITWWSNGYYLQYQTHMRVVADGGIYNGAYFYWLSNIFTSDNENLSVGICRMLQSGSIEAEKIAEDYFGDSQKATSVLKEILTLNRTDAKKVLEKNYELSPEKVDALLYSTHPNDDGDIYLIMYNDMKNMASVFAYYGLWDFENEVEYKTIYNEKNGEYTYPKELSNSVIYKWYMGENLQNFEKVYSNDSVMVFKVDK